MLIRVLSLAALLGVAPAVTAQGQEETDATLRAYAAGYKASFTCSATFNAAKAPDQIEADEFYGIYPLVAEIVPTLNAVVDTANKRVSVDYLDGMPPRISQWRPHLGCVQLPVGATTEIVDALPVPEGLPEVDARSDSGAPWAMRVPVNGPSGNSALDRAVARAFEEGPYGAAANTSAVLVATPTAILAERYKPGFTPTTSQRTWSVAKSIAASVVGAAVHKGLIGVTDTGVIPEYNLAHDPRRAIRLENFLHMASGLDSNVAGNRTDRLYMGGGLVTDTATENALEVAPGSRWKYANNDTLLAVRAVAGRFDSKTDYLAFPFEALLYKIGMTHTKLETDWDGDFILSSQVWTTARDLARLGLLHLKDGVWNGERILPAGWGDYVRTHAPVQPPRAGRDGSPRPGYGAQWWLYDDKFDGIPSDTYAARGNRGQSLVVIPSKNLIIVRRGYDPAGRQGFQLHDFIRDVVAALEE